METKAAHARLEHREQRNPDSGGGKAPVKLGGRKWPLRIRGRQPVVVMKRSNDR